MEYTLDAQPYFQILHTLIRQDGLDYDEENTAKAVEWIRENSGILRKIMTKEEWEVVMIYYAHWDNHKVAPDRKMMTTLIHSRQKSKGLLDVMDEYDKYAPTLEQVDYRNLGMYLDQRKLDYEKFKLSRMLDIAGQIAVGAIPDPVKKNVTWAGPKDAMKYLHQRFQEGVLIDDTRALGGSITEVGRDIVLADVERAVYGGREVLPTMTPIDSAMQIGPRETIKWVGIAGFSNQRKSTWLYTLAYQAAERGYKILFVPLESTVREAMRRFVWLHAYRIGRSGELPPLHDALNPRKVLKEHLQVIKEVHADMVNKGILIEVKDIRDFTSITANLNAHIDDPYDACYIDYIAHLDTPGVKDQREGIRDVYRAAQALSLSYEDGRGLVVVTPVQVNKNAEKEASDQENPMERGIYRDGNIGVIEYHTDAGRGMDALVGIWSGDGFKKLGLARVSCIKTRQLPFDPFFLYVDPRSQYVRHVSDADAARILQGRPLDKDATPKVLSPVMTQMIEAFKAEHPE